MQPLNAIDAITPAFTRTHQILFKPFRWGRSWKLAVTQYLGLMGAFFFPFPVLLILLPAGSIPPQVRVASTLAVAVSFALLCYLFYLGVRLQFVNFQMIVTREQFVAPMWRRYVTRVWPMIAVKVTIGTVLMLACLPLFVHFAHDFASMVQIFPQPPASQPPNPAMFQAFFNRIFTFYALIFGIFFVFKFASTLIEDLVLPFYTLEEISFSTACQRGFRTFLADPLQWTLYFIMKFVLSTTGFVMQYISNLVVLVPTMIVIFLVGLLVALIPGFAGHGHNNLGFIMAITVGELIVLTPLIWYQTGSLGYLFMLLEAYSIYFLGGRYPKLGDLLEPPPPVMYQYTPPPVFPSPEERKDDNDDGPSLPMNPALA